MSSTREKGCFGERLAEQYLRKNKYQIVDKNYYTRWGEIDIVARDENSQELVFVEVKMRNSNAYGFPEEAVDERKMEKMARTAEIYLDRKKQEENYRFDCLAIWGGAVDEGIKIKHYKNIGLM